MATISSTLAVVIAGLPQIKDSWKKPDRPTSFIYLGYTVVNTLFFFGGKTWSIEERFYPGCMIGLCLVITLVAFREDKPSTP